MANSYRRNINYKPRMSDFEAYELLPIEVRNEIKNGCIDYDAYALLRRCKKIGVAATVKSIQSSNIAWAKKPWISQGRYSIYGPYGTGELKWSPI